MARVDAATVGYDTVPVLRDVSVTVEPGRMLAVTGPSGAGKTTLLWTIAGLLRPTSGTVEIGGEPVRGRDDAVARDVVLVPEDNGLATVLTAVENLEIVLLGRRIPPAEARRRSAEWLARLGLSARVDQLVEELSGGQQQRVALARGLALCGAALLADEVTSQLDAENRQRALDLLRAEAQRGAAVLLATHDPDAADACDAELHLVDGRAELLRSAPVAVAASA